jgi:ABC-2 type transport system permease protein
MTAAIFAMELRLRSRAVILAAVGLIGLTAAVGALFPAFGNSIGDVHLPSGVSDILGGGNFATISGWLQAEVVSVYGPLVVAAVAITAATATTAGEEEDRILALVLAHPVPRSRLVLAKGAAVGVLLAMLTAAIFVGLVLAVAFAGGGIAVANLAAVALHLLFLGFALAALALALGAATGRRGATTAAAAAVTVIMFFINGFAPTIPAISWLRYLTVFHYYEGQNQIMTGVHPAGLAVLAALAAALTTAAVAGFARRDLRG